MNIFEQANQINAKVVSGELGGAVTWPLNGRAVLVEVKAEYKKGNPYIAFRLMHEEKGAQSFLVRLPNASDKDTAKFMSMQRLYATLYAAAKVPAGSKDPEPVFNALVEDIHQNGDLLVDYTLSEYETVSQQTGKTFINQSLESLKVIEDFA